MKTLKHHRIEAELTLDGEKTTHLVIENTSLLRYFLHGIETQLEEGEEFFHYFDNGKEKDFSKVGFFLFDVFHCPLDDKKIGTFLQKDIPSRLSDEQKESFQDITNRLQEFLHETLYDYPVPLTIDNETSLTTILKAFALAPLLQEENWLENLVMKIRLIRHVYKKEVFLFYNLHDFLDKEEFHLFQQEMRRAEISFLLLSSHIKDINSTSERVIRIDEDLYEQHIAIDRKEN